MTIAVGNLSRTIRTLAVLTCAGGALSCWAVWQHPQLLAAVLSHRAASSPVPNAPRMPADCVYPSNSNLPKAEEVASNPKTSRPHGRGFLGFRLPDESFCIEERQRFEIVPSLSRVGFDGKTPIDAFSVKSQQVRGVFEACPSKPASKPVADVVIASKSLCTGDKSRDKLLHKALNVWRYPEIRFRLKSFETLELDRDALSLRGTARCTMFVRGHERDLAVPVQLDIDRNRRLILRGEVTVRLSDMGVKVPTTFGMAMMSDDIKLWFGIRARSLGTGKPAATATSSVAQADATSKPGVSGKNPGLVGKKMVEEVADAR